MADTRFKCTIGMSICKDSSPDFFDGGLVYHGLDSKQIVDLEALFAKHILVVTEAMQPLIKDLIEMGYTEAAEKLAPTTPPGAIR